MVSNMARTKAETWFCFQTPEGGVLEESAVKSLYFLAFIAFIYCA